MIKRILAEVMVVTLVLTAVPTFADSSYSVDSNVVGTSSNPLVVSGDSDGIKYVSLGDSIAYGYGLTGDDILSCKGLMTIENSYPDLIHKYLKTNNGCDDSNFYQGAVCGERIVDMCYFFKPDEYSVDLTHINFKNNFLSEMKTDGSYDYTKYMSYKAGMPEAVKNADFITITAGGNDTFTFLLHSLSEPSNYVTSDCMSVLYGKSAVAAYDTAKNVLRAQAKIIDKVKGNEADEETGKAATEKSLDTVLGLADILLYSLGGYVKGEEDILDIIHEINPDAVIAITGLPSLLKDYDFQISEELIVDMDSLFTPMTKVLNDVVKNAAEERSSYVRYVDISGAEPLECYDLRLKTDSDSENIIDGKYVYYEYKNVIPADLIDDFISVNLLRITHPSENGHIYIANEIMKNFKFKTTGGKLATISNKLNNIGATILSKIGITKLANLLATIKSIDFSSFIKSFTGMPMILKFLVNK